MPIPIKLPAFAKINWFLRILGRRPDGYHELHTLLQTISLHDSLTFTALDDHRIVLSCTDPSLPTDETNLVFRAAAALQSRYQPRKGVRIRLEKRIPSQAGMGGGSADAAITLIALTSLWGLPVTPADLVEVARTLGADVPFFLFGGTALAVGVGTELQPQPDVAECFLLIIKPNTAVSTAIAYQSLHAPTLTTSDLGTILSGSPEISDYRQVVAALSNDFEPVLFRLDPEIGRAKAALVQAGARGALLAGSGSAVFGVFDNREAQERAIQSISLETGWRVFPCRTVRCDQYRSAMGLCLGLLAGGAE